MKRTTAVLVAVGAILIWALTSRFVNSDALNASSRSLRDTMLYAVEHYSSLEASYLHRVLVTTDGNEHQLTVDILSEPGVGALATLTRANDGVVKFVTDGKQLVEYDVTRDEYTVVGIAQPSPFQRASSIWERVRVLFEKGKGAAHTIGLRQEVTELPLGWTSTAIFPQQWVLGTYDVSRVIHHGPEQFLGRVTQKVEVVAPNGRSFNVNVDQETGVLLRVELIENGKVSEVIEATHFKVNVPVDRSKFTIPDLTGEKVRIPG